MILRRDENSSSVEKLSVAGELSPIKTRSPDNSCIATPNTTLPSPPLSPIPTLATRIKLEKEDKDEVVVKDKSPIVVTSPEASYTSPKPFFIMDWLEDLDPADLELARKIMLKTPQKLHTNVAPTQDLVPCTSSSSTSVVESPSSETLEGEGADVQPRDLFQATTPTSTNRTFQKRTSTTTTSTPPKAPSSSSETISFYRKRSIAVGNGWNAKGLSKARQGLWQDALACWKNALVVRTQVLGEQHIDVANTANNMGIAHGKLQQAPQAMAMLQMALEIRQHHYGTKHPEVAATLHNIGNVLQQCGELEPAIVYFGRAMELQKDLVGTDRHALVARAGMAMGHAYYQGQLYPHALTAYCDALSIFEYLQDQQQQQHGEGGKEDDFSAEIEATRADVQELQELISRQASSSY